MVGTTVVNTTSEEREIRPQTTYSKKELRIFTCKERQKFELKSIKFQHPIATATSSSTPLEQNSKANWVGKKGRQLKAESLPLERRDDWWELFSPATIPHPPLLFHRKEPTKGLCVLRVWVTFSFCFWCLESEVGGIEKQSA